MEIYKWVSEGSIRKFDRAILEFKNLNKQLVAQGKEELPITEERIKARYIQMAGKVLEVDEEVKAEVETEDSEVEDKPKRGRPFKVNAK